MILTFLNKPFPRLDLDKRSVRTSFFIGCFVTLFLVVFEPFQLSEWQTDYKILKLAGFGMVSFIMPLILNIIVAHIVYKKAVEDNWTIGKEILTIIIVLILIAFGNLMYGYMLCIIPLTIKGFFFALSTVVTIGVFPITLHVIRKHNKLLKINFEQAVIVNKHLHHDEIKTDGSVKTVPGPDEEILPNDPSQLRAEIKTIPKLVFIAENEKDKIELTAEQLLYIESADNYSNIVFMEDDKVKKQLIRSSLKRIESQITFDHIVRCHRTFIVNLKNVKSIEGNAAGYKLSFADANYFVPVSRNFGNTIIEKLKIIK
ncbi:MAG: LytTR family DNA-binding domain-containing protein [Bacteroidia bacterium]